MARISVREDRDAFFAIAPATAFDRERFRARQKIFVAFDGERPIARTLARFDGDVGMLGFFEAENAPDAVSTLLDYASAWLTDRGATTIIGPIDGDTWHRYRVNAGPFELPPFLLEPVNPTYYAALWEQAGFKVKETYSSKQVGDVSPLLPRIESVYQRALSHGYRFAPIDPSKLKGELTRVWRMSLEIFRENAFYSDIGRDEFLELYAGIERILVPDLVWFATDANGEDAGFLFAYPDATAGVVNYKTIGVTPQHRSHGLSIALQFVGYREAVKRGARTANHCLMREGNRSQSLDEGHGTTFRRYILYSAPE